MLGFVLIILLYICAFHASLSSVVAMGTIKLTIEPIWFKLDPVRRYRWCHVDREIDRLKWFRCAKSHAEFLVFFLTFS